MGRTSVDVQMVSEKIASISFILVHVFSCFYSLQLGSNLFCILLASSSIKLLAAIGTD